MAEWARISRRVLAAGENKRGGTTSPGSAGGRSRLSVPAGAVGQLAILNPGLGRCSGRPCWPGHYGGNHSARVTRCIASSHLVGRSHNNTPRGRHRRGGRLQPTPADPARGAPAPAPGPLGRRRTGPARSCSIPRTSRTGTSPSPARLSGSGSPCSSGVAECQERGRRVPLGCDATRTGPERGRGA